MTAVVAILAFVVGAALGAALAVWWLNRRSVAQPSLEAAPVRPAATAGEDDTELKPILDATRGVLSDLEERYRGARAEEQSRSKRRSSKSDG